jgi:hypothetical protein
MSGGMKSAIGSEEALPDERAPAAAVLRWRRWASAATVHEATSDEPAWKITG